MGYKQGYVTVYYDNQNFTHMSRNPQHYERTKHVDVKFHFVRGIVERGLMSMNKIHTSVNPSYMLTKVNKGNHCC